MLEGREFVGFVGVKMVRVQWRKTQGVRLGSSEAWGCARQATTPQAGFKGYKNVSFRIIIFYSLDWPQNQQRLEAGSDR
jgi:hypothetical protein